MNLASELRTCGKRGLKVTPLGLGGASLGREAGESALNEAGARTLEVAHELGLRHVDTSPMYGASEHRLGIALRRSSLPGLTISTKVGTHPSRRYSYTREDLRWTLQNSLLELGRDRVDVALVHDPPSLDMIFKPGDGFDALEELREEGVCSNVGLGVQSHPFHRAAIEGGRVDVILTYGDYNLIRRSGAELMLFARQHQVGVFLGSPQMHGFLAAGEEPIRIIEARPHLFKWYTRDDVMLAQEWYEWCREREVGMRHLNMRFVRECDLVDCVLTGAGSESEIRTNVREWETPIPADVWAQALERIQTLDDMKS